MVNIPETFRAPHLRYLMVMGFHIPIGSPSFTTMENLVTLSLNFDIPWIYFHVNPLLRQILLTPQLETSGNTFNTRFPRGGTESQLLRRAVMRRVTPYLCRFGLQGANAYLEALLPRATIRFIERLQLYFLDQLRTYLILPRRFFITSADIVWLNTVRLTFFKDYLRADAFTHDMEFRSYRLSMSQGGRDSDRQLASVTKFFHILRTVFSRVENLILRYDGHLMRSELDNEADPTQWRDLFRTFGNVKSLYIDYRLAGQLSRFLQPDGGESPTDPLPELRELWYSTTDELDDELFVEFVYARRNSGRPVAVFQAVIDR